jgi:hypothetical protein
VLSYATPILESVGLSSFSSILEALFKVVATLSAVVTVDHFGRKRLLYLGCTLMLVALIVLSMTFGDKEYEKAVAESSMTIHNVMILTSMFVYIGGYQVSGMDIAIIILPSLRSKPTLSLSKGWLWSNDMAHPQQKFFPWISETKPWLLRGRAPFY